MSPLHRCSLACLLAYAGHAAAADLPEYQGDPIIVTAPRSVRPLVQDIDPRDPPQPVPAADGADLLKTIPGFSVIRKGGASGDPLLRGLGGSRLAILADGGYVFGGCGGRMDPPTAYLYPDAYDKITVFKGPQTVTLGPGLVAGAVNFERNTPRFTEAGTHGSASILAGNAERLDGYVDASFGQPLGYLRLIGSHNEGGDYKDGAGNKVHSAFDRDSGTVIAGLTPDDTTKLEFSLDQSRGQAAYADRSVDGSKFDRDAWSVKAEKRALTAWLDKLSLYYSHSYVDHVMDNYTLRDGTPPMKRAAMNPDRTADTARLAADLAFGELALTVGADWLRDRHSNRMAMGPNADSYSDKTRVPDQSFDSLGAFAEGRLPLGAAGTLIAGLRQDRTQAVYEPQPASMGMMGMSPATPRSQQDYDPTAGFVRYEHKLGGLTAYAGLGHTERAPDYWERNRANQQVRPELSDQLDLGLLYADEALSGSLSLFANRIDDFILIDNNSPLGTRNVDARRYGFEGDATWRFAGAWKLAGTLAYTYGENLSDNTPLAQTPPLAGSVTLGWDNGVQGAALVWRGAMRHTRVAPGQGNIAGVDIGETGGYGVLGINAGWQLAKQFRLSAGIDNLFNKNYAEAVSKGGVSVPGYDQTTQVNEPGRTLWVKLAAKW
ncbi:TonB-dependent copper receptor [Neisseriaceae bacterium JH1-16]|nr:TonB-dependent copper receptor [Neisseriaceae bacterium JH1-16]